MLFYLYSMVFFTDAALINFTNSVVCPIRSQGVITYLPDPTNCTNYYVCTNGVALLFSCGNGRTYSKSKFKCDLKSQETTETQFKGDYIDKDNECNQRIECPKNQSYKKYRTHPRDCQQYFKCKRGTPIMNKCHNGLEFSEKKQKCVHKKKEVCDSKCLSKFGESCNPTVICSRSYQYRQHPTDCSKYYKCKKDKPKIYTCRKGLYFSTKDQRCLARLASEHNTCCTKQLDKDDHAKKSTTQYLKESDENNSNSNSKDHSDELNSSEENSNNNIITITTYKKYGVTTDLGEKPFEISTKPSRDAHRTVDLIEDYDDHMLLKSTDEMQDTTQFNTAASGVILDEDINTNSYTNKFGNNVIQSTSSPIQETVTEKLKHNFTENLKNLQPPSASNYSSTQTGSPIKIYHNLKRNETTTKKKYTEGYHTNPDFQLLKSTANYFKEVSSYSETTQEINDSILLNMEEQVSTSSLSERGDDDYKLIDDTVVVSQKPNAVESMKTTTNTKTLEVDNQSEVDTTTRRVLGISTRTTSKLDDYNNIQSDTTQRPIVFTSFPESATTAQEAIGGTDDLDSVISTTETNLSADEGKMITSSYEEISNSGLLLEPVNNEDDDKEITSNVNIAINPEPITGIEDKQREKNTTPASFEEPNIITTEQIPYNHLKHTNNPADKLGTSTENIAEVNSLNKTANFTEITYNKDDVSTDLEERPFEISTKPSTNAGITADLIEYYHDYKLLESTHVMQDTTQFNTIVSTVIPDEDININTYTNKFGSNVIQSTSSPIQETVTEELKHNFTENLKNLQSASASNYSSTQTGSPIKIDHNLKRNETSTTNKYSEGYHANPDFLLLKSTANYFKEGSSYRETTQEMNDSILLNMEEQVSTSSLSERGDDDYKLIDDTVVVSQKPNAVESIKTTTNTKTLEVDNQSVVDTTTRRVVGISTRTTSKLDDYNNIQSDTTQRPIVFTSFPESATTAQEAIGGTDDLDSVISTTETNLSADEGKMITSSYEEISNSGLLLEPVNNEDDDKEITSNVNIAINPEPITGIEDKQREKNTTPASFEEPNIITTEQIAYNHLKHTTNPADKLGTSTENIAEVNSLNKTANFTEITYNKDDVSTDLEERPFEISTKPSSDADITADLIEDYHDHNLLESTDEMQDTTQFNTAASGVILDEDINTNSYTNKFGNNIIQSTSSPIHETVTEELKHNFTENLKNFQSASASNYSNTQTGSPIKIYHNLKRNETTTNKKYTEGYYTNPDFQLLKSTANYFKEGSSYRETTQEINDSILLNMEEQVSTSSLSERGDDDYKLIDDTVVVSQKPNAVESMKTTTNTKILEVDNQSEVDTTTQRVLGISTRTSKLDDYNNIQSDTTQRPIVFTSFTESATTAQEAIGGTDDLDSVISTTETNLSADEGKMFTSSYEEISNSGLLLEPVNNEDDDKEITSNVNIAINQEPITGIEDKQREKNTTPASFEEPNIIPTEQIACNHLKHTNNPADKSGTSTENIPKVNSLNKTSNLTEITYNKDDVSTHLEERPFEISTKPSSDADITADLTEDNHDHKLLESTDDMQDTTQFNTAASGVILDEDINTNSYTNKFGNNVIQSTSSPIHETVTEELKHNFTENLKNLQSASASNYSSTQTGSPIKIYYNLKRNETTTNKKYTEGYYTNPDFLLLKSTVNYFKESSSDRETTQEINDSILLNMEEQVSISSLSKRGDDDYKLIDDTVVVSQKPNAVESMKTTTNTKTLEVENQREVDTTTRRVVGISTRVTSNSDDYNIIQGDTTQRPVALTSFPKSATTAQEAIGGIDDLDSVISTTETNLSGDEGNMFTSSYEEISNSGLLLEPVNNEDDDKEITSNVNIAINPEPITGIEDKQREKNTTPASFEEPNIITAEQIACNHLKHTNNPADKLGTSTENIPEVNSLNKTANFTEITYNKDDVSTDLEERPFEISTKPSTDADITADLIEDYDDHKLLESTHVMQDTTQFNTAASAVILDEDININTYTNKFSYKVIQSTSSPIQKTETEELKHNFTENLKNLQSASASNYSNTQTGSPIKIDHNLKRNETSTTNKYSEGYHANPDFLLLKSTANYFKEGSSYRETTQEINDSIQLNMEEQVSTSSLSERGDDNYKLIDGTVVVSQKPNAVESLKTTTNTKTLEVENQREVDTTTRRVVGISTTVTSNSDDYNIIQGDTIQRPVALTSFPKSATTAQEALGETDDLDSVISTTETNLSADEGKMFTSSYEEISNSGLLLEPVNNEDDDKEITSTVNIAINPEPITGIEDEQLEKNTTPASFEEPNIITTEQIAYNHLNHTNNPADKSGTNTENIPGVNSLNKTTNLTEIPYNKDDVSTDLEGRPFEISTKPSSDADITAGLIEDYSDYKLLESTDEMQDTTHFNNVASAVILDEDINANSYTNKFGNKVVQSTSSPIQETVPEELKHNFTENLKNLQSASASNYSSTQTGSPIKIYHNLKRNETTTNKKYTKGYHTNLDFQLLKSTANYFKEGSSYKETTQEINDSILLNMEEQVSTSSLSERGDDDYKLIDDTVVVSQKPNAAESMKTTTNTKTLEVDNQSEVNTTTRRVVGISTRTTSKFDDYNTIQSDTTQRPIVFTSFTESATTAQEAIGGTDDLDSVISTTETNLSADEGKMFTSSYEEISNSGLLLEPVNNEDDDKEITSTVNIAINLEPITGIEDEQLEKNTTPASFEEPNIITTEQIAYNHFNHTNNPADKSGTSTENIPGVNSLNKTTNLTEIPYNKDDVSTDLEERPFEISTKPSTDADITPDLIEDYHDHKLLESTDVMQDTTQFNTTASTVIPDEDININTYTNKFGSNVIQSISSPIQKTVTKELKHNFTESLKNLQSASASNYSSTQTGSPIKIYHNLKRNETTTKKKYSEGYHTHPDFQLLKSTANYFKEGSSYRETTQEMNDSILLNMEEQVSSSSLREREIDDHKLIDDTAVVSQKPNTVVPIKTTTNTNTLEVDNKSRVDITTPRIVGIPTRTTSNSDDYNIIQSDTTQRPVVATSFPESATTAQEAIDKAGDLDSVIVTTETNLSTDQAEMVTTSYDAMGNNGLVFDHINSEDSDIEITSTVNIAITTEQMESAMEEEDTIYASKEPKNTVSDPPTTEIGSIH